MEVIDMKVSRLYKINVGVAVLYIFSPIYDVLYL